jgi:hypothetical protein
MEWTIDTYDWLIDAGYAMYQVSEGNIVAIFRVPYQKN